MTSALPPIRCFTRQATIRANALIQSSRLVELSPLLAGMIESGSLQLATGYFDIRSGEVTLLDEA